MLVVLRTVILLSAFFVAGASAGFGSDAITRVWTEFREEESLRRLGDYFGRDPESGRVLWLRSDAEVREGYYFTIRLRAREGRPLEPGTLRLRLIPPDGEDARIFDFPFEPVNKRTTRVELGVTGADWPYGDVLPLAWQIEVLDRDGQVRASRNSFLWENP